MSKMKWWLSLAWSLSFTLVIAGIALAAGPDYPTLNFTSNQVLCGTTATLAAVNRNRNAVTIKVPTGGVTVFIGGGTGVTATNGFSVDPGTAMTLQPYSGPVYCVVSTGTQTVSIAETY